MAGNFASNLQLLQKYPSFEIYELLLPAMDFRDKYPLNDQDAIRLREQREHREQKARKQQQQTQRVGRSQSVRQRPGGRSRRNPPKSPRDVFRKHMNSAKGMLERQTSRSKSPGRRRVTPNNYIFNARGPKQPAAMHAQTKQQSFSFGSWKKRWNTK